MVESPEKKLPYLYQTAMSLLHIPATSVPSERIFSEAGYIARARRSRILPRKLDQHLFLKKNIDYAPTEVKAAPDEAVEKAGIDVEDISMHEDD